LDLLIQVVERWRGDQMSDRCKIFPELRIKLWCGSKSCGPRKKHDGRASGKRQRGGQPGVRKDVEHFLIVDVEHHIQTPPQHKVGPDLQSLCCGLGGSDLLLFYRNNAFLREPISSRFPGIDGVRLDFQSR